MQICTPVVLLHVQCREALKKLGEGRLEKWTQEFAGIADSTVAVNAMYAMPRITPVFLGCIFNRVGYPGAVRPSASFFELEQIQQCITHKLMPTLDRLNMTLDAALYAQICDVAVPRPGAPASVDGVAAHIMDFHSLEHMALCACVPAPFLQPHHLWTVNMKAFNAWTLQAANAQNHQPPAGPDEALIHLKVSKKERKRYKIKLARIRPLFERLAEIIVMVPVPVVILA